RDNPRSGRHSVAGRRLTDIEPRRSSADGSGRGQGGRSPPAEKSRTLRPRTPQPYPKITKTLFLAKDPHAIRVRILRDHGTRPASVPAPVSTKGWPRVSAPQARNGGEPSRAARGPSPLKPRSAVNRAEPPPHVHPLLTDPRPRPSPGLARNAALPPAPQHLP